MKPVIMVKPSSKKKTTLSLEHILGIPYQVVIVALIMVPLILILVYSFQAKTTAGVFSLVFTFENYARFFNEQIFVRLMAESIYLAFGATIITLCIGYPLAFIISRSKPKTRLLLILLVTAPMWINMLLRTRALQQIFTMINPELLGSNFIIMIGMTYNFLPFMVLPIYTVLAKIDNSLFESASDLGANKIQTMIKVIIPLSFSGILSGVMMVFLPAATTLVVPKYLGEGRFLIGNLIENAMISQGDFGYGSAIALVMAGMILVFLYLIKKVDTYQGANDET
jgi:spermidine/putrescine transport system permease protein